MGKFLQKAAGVWMAVALAGCFSFEHVDRMPLRGNEDIHGARGEKLREHLVISNYGWYFFNTWPIVCGNAREGASTPWVFFRNDVDETVLQNRLTKYAARREGNVSDLVMFNHEQILMDLYGIPVPIPYICCFREMQFSCVLTPRAGTPGAPSENLRRDMDDLLKSLPAEGGAK